MSSKRWIDGQAVYRIRARNIQWLASLARSRLPGKKNLRILKTDLWNEAKKSERFFLDVQGDRFGIDISNEICKLAGSWHENGIALVKSPAGHQCPGHARPGTGATGSQETSRPPGTPREPGRGQDPHFSPPRPGPGQSQPVEQAIDCDRHFQPVLLKMLDQ